jgi:glycosyltransferase involved in cell wall biosynthesis
VKTRPQATIVVTTCNRPGLAARAVRSATSQTEPAVQILVIDDGENQPVSLGATDDRVRVIRTDGHVGVSKARNVGLAEAVGQWITFLDDDDELLPHMIEASLTAARTSSLSPPVAVVSGMEELAPNGTVALTRVPVSMPRGRHYFLEDLVPTDRRGLAAYNTLFAPVDVLREIGGFDEEMRAWMHLDLMLKLNPVCSIQAVRSVGYRMFHHGDPRLSSAHMLRAQAMIRTYENNRDAFRQHPRARAHHLGRTGIMYLRAGAWLRPISLTAKAFVIAPRNRRAVQQLVFAIGGPQLFGWYERRKARSTARTSAFSHTKHRSAGGAN